MSNERREGENDEAEVEAHNHHSLNDEPGVEDEVEAHVQTPNVRMDSPSNT